MLQFQVWMESRDVLVSPELDSLVVSYDTLTIPAYSSEAWISPVEIPIGQDVELTYAMRIEVGEENTGIERIAILTQWPASVDWSAISLSGPAQVDVDRSYVTDDSLVVFFSPPITESVELLSVPFRGRILSSKHRFTSLLFAPGSENGLRSDERLGPGETD